MAAPSLAPVGLAELVGWHVGPHAQLVVQRGHRPPPYRGTRFRAASPVECAAVTDAVVGDIAAAASARASSPQYPTAFVARARAEAQRLSAFEVAPDDMRGALLLLEQRAQIDPVVPVASHRKPVGAVKSGLRRLMLWYVRYVADQVTVLGQAVSRFGTAVATRVEDLEAQTASDRRRYDASLAALDERVSRLEQGRDG